MSTPQRGILEPVPLAGRFLTLGLRPDADPRPALDRLAGMRLEGPLVLGLGSPLVLAVGAKLPGLRAFPALAGPKVSVPSTQGAVWAFLGGADAGRILLRARSLVSLLGDSFRVDEEVLSFRFEEGRDLSGFEDGTENPKDDRAREVAIVSGRGAGLDGGSFVAVQRWVHDLARLEAMTGDERDLVIGRRLETNEEIASAPASAHVKRSAQESFDPPAFMLRRSMPYGSTGEHGLEFVAYGASLDPFERVLGRMVGLEDGVADGLFRFSRPVTGGYYFCPPVRDGRLDLRAISS